ncbi:hypothetical protein FB451DRAFT_1263415 [Mycena latifolia]|nr:hypothetical protein FB451DRAFT_1263415 [Mycena latifolia]
MPARLRYGTMLCLASRRCFRGSPELTDTDPILHISPDVWRACPLPAMTFAPRWAPSNDTLANDVVVADARLANYFAAAAFTILFIEFFSTVDEEIHFVWKKPWSIPSVLYLWNRYMTLFTVILSMHFMFKETTSDHTCGTFIITEGIASTLLFCSFDFLLMLRVWILYGKTRKIAYILFPMLLFELVSMIITLLLPATYIREFIHLGPVLPGCYFSKSIMVGSSFALYAVPPLLVTFTMFVMTVHKCALILRRDKLVDMPIITLILRDGIVWFIVVFFFYGSEMIIWATARASLTNVLVIPSLALFSLISSRVLLQTRALSSSRLDDEEEHEHLLPPVGSRAGWRR